MNQKLRDLSRLSGFIVDETGTFSEFAEKTRLACFADLIIKECINLADNEAERFSNLDQEYCAMAMDNYRELVRKHFGITE